MRQAGAMDDPVQVATALETLLVADKLPARALETIGYRFGSLDPETGEVVVSFEAVEAFGNLMGNVQGGFVAAMLDATVATALMATLEPDQVAPTLELKISYLRPVPLGPLVGRGRVVHRGGTIGFLAGELYDEEEQVLATATATVRIITPQG
jgi:uncharacterized protein (TIGR00369 family)